MVSLSLGEKKEIENSIKLAEKMTSGEIRVHLKDVHKIDIYEEAKKTFYKLKMHKTKEKNGVLIFISLETKQFAIIGDKGIHEKVGNDFWDCTRDKMLECFKENKIKDGIIVGVLNVGEKLKRYFPYHKEDENELSDSVSE